MVHDGTGTVLGQRLVVGGLAGSVGVTYHVGTQLRVLTQGISDRVQDRQQGRLEGVAVRVERNRAWYVDLEGAIRLLGNVNTHFIGTRLVDIALDPTPVVAGDAACHSANTGTDHGSFATVAKQSAQACTQGGTCASTYRSAVLLVGGTSCDHQTGNRNCG